MLVTRWNRDIRTHEIVSLHESGVGFLSEMSEHPISFPNNARILVRSWILAVSKLVLVDQNSNRVFSFSLNDLNL